MHWPILLRSAPPQRDFGVCKGLFSQSVSAGTGAGMGGHHHAAQLWCNSDGTNDRGVSWQGHRLC